MEIQPDDAQAIAGLDARVQQRSKELKTLTTQVHAERDRLREQTVRKVLDNYAWVTPKARAQFEQAYLPKVKYDEDGSRLVVDTPAGPCSFALYLDNELGNSPYFLDPSGKDSSEAQPERRRPAVLEMTTAQISAMPPSARETIMREALGSLRAAPDGQNLLGMSTKEIIDMSAERREAAVKEALAAALTGRS